MLESALLLTGDHSTAHDRRAEKLLQFFDVPYEKQSGTDFRPSDSGSAGSIGGYRILCAAQTFASVVRERKKAIGWNGFEQQVHSVFLYSDGDPVALAKIVSQLSEANISVCRGAKSHSPWHVADEPDGICGAMRGLHVQPAATTLSNCDFFELNESSVNTLIASEDKTAFLKLTCGEISVFVSSVPLLDIDADLTTRNFDVRDHLFSAVPVVSYIRWAFPQKLLECS